MEKTELMSSNEVLKYLKISHNTLYRWIKLKNFPAPQQKQASKSFWSKPEVDSWLDRSGKEV